MRRRGMRGENGSYGEREYTVVGTCVGGGVYVGKLWQGSFWGKGLLSRVFTADERCSEHPHVCHSTKCERNQTIPGPVIAI